MNDYTQRGRSTTALAAISALGLFADSIYSHDVRSAVQPEPDRRNHAHDAERIAAAKAKRERKAAKKLKEAAS